MVREDADILSMSLESEDNPLFYVDVAALATFGAEQGNQHVH